MAANLANVAIFIVKRALRLAISPEGRFGVVAIAAGLFLGLFFRDQLIEALGWGIAPAAVWVGGIMLFGLARPRLLLRYWKPAVATFFATGAAIGVLGILDGPEDFGSDPGLLAGSTLGGYVGDILVREPAEWEFENASNLQLVLGSLRVLELLALATIAMWPGRSRVFYARLWAFYVATGKVLYRAASQTAKRWATRLNDGLNARLEARREAAEARAALSAVETEASLQENPSYRIGKSEPEIPGGVAEETAEIVPDVLPTPSREELWTGEEAAAVAALVAAAQAAAGVESAAADDTLIPDSESPESDIGDTEGGEYPEVPRFEWKLPSLDLLTMGQTGGITNTEIEATSDLIVHTLADHGVDVSVDQVRPGPTVTMYGVAPGYSVGRGSSAAQDGQPQHASKRVRVDTILNREKDLALALASPSIRFEAPIPGASLVGIEVPNANPTGVALRSVMETDAFKEFEKEAELPIALGIGSGGDAIFADLTRMPHMLVAGSTGSGKSVCMNSIITGLLLLRTPHQVRMILMDPKRVELTPYAGAPHLMIPPIVEADVAVAALRAVVTEMMSRFQLLEKAGTKNIASYNEKADVELPYLVIAIDELADLMLTSANEVERLLVRLAQLGRATGIHLVVATQRPSVDVVTGLIKANFPSRISFSLTSQVDSRTIIDSVGAEKLLGKGDMLFLPIDRPKPLRVQGAFLADSEIESVIAFWRNAGGPPMPKLAIPETSEGGPAGKIAGDGGTDEMFNRALELAHTQTRLSTSLLQRRLRIGYPRAARLMDELEDAGVVGPGEPGKPRVVIG
jgi:S-DNA-T family DNA segregation ATPase FtsK/SpoIIIE